MTKSSAPGDENGETEKWHQTCGMDGWKSIPQKRAMVVAAGAGLIKIKRELRLERTGRDDEPERRIGGMCSGHPGT